MAHFFVFFISMKIICMVVDLLSTMYIIAPSPQKAGRTLKTKYVHNIVCYFFVFLKTNAS